MAGKIDLIRLQTQVETAIEVLLRAADTRLSWNQSSHPPNVPTETSGVPDATTTSSAATDSLPYAFLPGVYRSVPPNPQEHDANVVVSGASPVTHASATELNDGELQLVLHGDNTFEYSWTMKRSGARAMEFSVEMQGEWEKPVLNRSRRGDEDQRMFLHTKRMRFQRLSNYDAEHGTWKLCLKTLARRGSEWTPVGETERGVPPIVMVLVCSSSQNSKDGGTGASYLESTGAAVVSQILSNSPACRVLAGLTKKIANKLGAPIDVMTDKWLPVRHVRLALVPDERQRVRAFNPFYWLHFRLEANKAAIARMDSMTPTAVAAVAAVSGANASGALSVAGGGAVPGATVLPNADSHTNKNAPHLHSVASSLRSCLDGMLPDTLRNDAAAFHQHLDQQKNRIQTEKNSWRFGLNYLFETLKQHKDWYARNQQFVQLKKDVKRFETHVSTIRSILSESVSKLDLEAGLRVAELEGRVGAYKTMFEVTKIVTKLSRPLVKLQILKPDESSMSIYCDTFVLDIVLDSGEGAVESASLTTVEKDQTKQFPERDEDLLRSLKLLAAGKSANFTVCDDAAGENKSPGAQLTIRLACCFVQEKLIRLINRAELAVKYPSINFEQLEEDLYLKISEACSQQACWTAKRAVEGITIHFKDPLNCAPISEPPRKKMKVEDTQAGAGAGATAAIATSVSDLSSTADKAPAIGGGGDRGHGANDDESSPKDVESATPLANGEWSGSVSCFEWRGEVALHVVGYSPIVMVGVQARRLAQCAMRPYAEGAAATPIDPQEEEKCFNEFVTWSLPDGTKPITPQLHFARDHSVCSVMPVQSTLGMRQEYSLTTKEISGGLRLASFPIPLANASTDTFSSVLQICGHSLFFHSVLLSAFTSKSNIFGRRIPADSEDAVNALIKVDVAAPERITLHTGELLGPGKQVLLEIGTKMDCSLEMSMKFLATTPRANGAAAGVVELEDTATMQKLSSACHSVPLLTYYALKRALQTKNGQSTARTTTDTVNGADCNGIVALDDDLNGTMKLEGEEDMLLDDMGLF